MSRTWVLPQSDFMHSAGMMQRACPVQVTVLVHNAGVAKGFGKTPLEDDVEGWDTMLAVNLAAPMRLVHLLGPSMAEQGGSAVIINISSVAGLDPMPLNSGYATSKWGLTG